MCYMRYINTTPSALIKQVTLVSFSLDVDIPFRPGVLAVHHDQQLVALPHFAMKSRVPLFQKV